VKSTNLLLYGILRNSGLQKKKKKNAEKRKPKTLKKLPYSKTCTVRKRSYNQKQKHPLRESWSVTVLPCGISWNKGRSCRQKPHIYRYFVIKRPFKLCKSLLPKKQTSKWTRKKFNLKLKIFIITAESRAFSWETGDRWASPEFPPPSTVCVCVCVCVCIYIYIQDVRVTGIQKCMLMF